MHERCISIVLVCMLSLAACGGSGQPATTTGQEAQGDGSAAPAAAPAAETTAGDPGLAERIAAADLERGKVLFLQCRACHSLVPETEPGKIGPTLYGVVGRAAGSVPNYDYSQAVRESGITWTPDQIDRWLARPSDFLPGNKMVFIGVQDPQDRANIIAFIQQESSKPASP
jgi:cytochrome c